MTFVFMIVAIGIRIVLVLDLFRRSVIHPIRPFGRRNRYSSYRSAVSGGFISVQQRLLQPTKVDFKLKYIDLKRSGTSLLLRPLSTWSSPSCYSRS